MKTEACVVAEAGVTLGAVVEGKRVVGTALGRDEAVVRRAIKRRWPGVRVARNRELERRLTSALRGDARALVARVDWDAVSAFDRRVLRELVRVPAGRTVTYGELARRIGQPRAARAVGGAVGRNPFPVVVPCHRVVRSDGSLGGFSAPGGTGLKRKLLKLDRA